MRETAPTRRGFLAAAGATLLAGCNGLGGISDTSEDSIPSHRLPDGAQDGEAEPIVVETVPVEIEQQQLAARTERVTDLLGTLPMPFGPEDVPNGHVRERLVHAANDATAHVEDARTAPSRLSALQSLRDARSRARYAAAGWAFAEDETTKDELQAEHEQAVRAANAERSDHAYLGTDPVRAALVHARIERNLDLAITDRSPSAYGTSGSLLEVAEWGEHAEEATALVSDSQYLYNQLTSSLPDSATSIEASLTRAVESVEATLRNWQSELPAPPTEGEDDSTWRVRYELHDAAESSTRRVSQAPGPASALLNATAGLTAFLAYYRMQDRIEGGEQFTVETAADVREARSQALEAIRTALEQSPRSELARPVLADAAWTVAYADEELSRFRGNVRIGRLDDPVRRYTTATLRARSVPMACQQVLDEFEE